jgi:hypothetical protein
MGFFHSVAHQTGTTGDQFRPFEGFWLTTKPSGAIACAKIIDERLFVPYSFGKDGKLTGHYYDCQVVGKTLFCRFEQFDSAVGGVLFLNPGSDETLKGGRWLNNKIPEIVRHDLPSLSDSLPGMQAVVWVRMNKETPEWAKKYFTEEWPNKPKI